MPLDKFRDSLTKHNSNCFSTSYKRVKERTIKDAIKKVVLWRRLYQGVKRSDGCIVRYELSDAARKVKLSRKSLDYYLQQIRTGIKYKYDFKNGQDKKIGELRKYIKLCRL